MRPPDTSYTGQGGSWDLQDFEEFHGWGEVKVLLAVLFYQCFILHGKMFATCKLCMYCIMSCFRGLRPQIPPGLCPSTPLGDFRHPYPLFSRYLQTLVTPLHTILPFYTFITFHGYIPWLQLETTPVHLPS